MKCKEQQASFNVLKNLAIQTGIISSNFLLRLHLQVSFLEPLNLQQPLSAVPTNSLGTVTVGIGTGVGILGTGTLQHQHQHQPQLPPSSNLPPSSIGTGAAEIAANAVAIKTVEEIFDTKRSYKRSTGRSKQRQPRRPNSTCEVKYINENFSSGMVDWLLWKIQI